MTKWIRVPGYGAYVNLRVARAIRRYHTSENREFIRIEMPYHTNDIDIYYNSAKDADEAFEKYQALLGIGGERET